MLLLAGGLGLLVGVWATLAFRFSERAAAHLPPMVAPELDDGLVRTLAVLRSAAVVLDDADHVVRASAPAHALGIVRDGRIAPAAIRDLIAQVRRDGVIRDEVLEVPRGPVGPGRAAGPGARRAGQRGAPGGAGGGPHAGASPRGDPSRLRRQRLARAQDAGRRARAARRDRPGRGRRPGGGAPVRRPDADGGDPAVGAGARDHRAVPAAGGGRPRAGSGWSTWTWC